MDEAIFGVQERKSPDVGSRMWCASYLRFVLSVCKSEDKVQIRNACIEWIHNVYGHDLSKPTKGRTNLVEAARHITNEKFIADMLGKEVRNSRTGEVWKP